MKIRFTGKGVNHVEEFMVAREYRAGEYVYRAVSLSGGYLSEAEASSVRGVIKEVCAIEEVSVDSITIEGKNLEGWDW